MQCLKSIAEKFNKTSRDNSNSNPQVSEKKSEENVKHSVKMGNSKFPSAGDPIFKNPEVYFTPPEIIKNHGFPCETHEVISKDGYILSLFRIPHGNIGNADSNCSDESPNRPVVLFSHGILNSGAVWIMNSTEQVLPYQLANLGFFDCWILNMRGCEYSKKHSELSPTSRKYWDFSWQEIADFDIPIVINYILQTSKQKSLYYIGHSMGCTVLFAATALHPELSEKIKLMIAFAPAVFLKHARTPYITWGAKIPGIQTMVSSIYHGEFCLRPTVKLVRRFEPLVWIWKKREARDSAWWCLKIMNQVNGSDPEQINWPLLPVIAGHLPSPTSVRTYTHFLQLYSSGEFRKFNYGSSKNIKVYGQAEPPSYDLSKSTFPVGIFYGDNDACVAPDDAIRLSKELPNVVKCHRVEHPSLTHIGFLFAKDADLLINKHVIELIMNDLQK